MLPPTCAFCDCRIPFQFKFCKSCDEQFVADFGAEWKKTDWAIYKIRSAEAERKCEARASKLAQFDVESGRQLAEMKAMAAAIVGAAVEANCGRVHISRILQSAGLPSEQGFVANQMKRYRAGKCDAAADSLVEVVTTIKSTIRRRSSGSLQLPLDLLQ